MASPERLEEMQPIRTSTPWELTAWAAFNMAMVLPMLSP